MKDSVVYQRILSDGIAQGRIEEAQRGIQAMQETLLRLGEDRYGPADEAIRRRVAEVRSFERLQELAVRVLHAANWDELFADPPT